MGWQHIGARPRGRNLPDSAWIAVVGVAVGGVLASGSALLQPYVQRRFDAANRERQEVTDRHADLRVIYTRYSLAVDGLEEAIRVFSKARQLELSERDIDPLDIAPAAETFEPAQREYDEACQILNLVAPVRTIDLARKQRSLYNGLVREALEGKYDFGASNESIKEASEPLLAAMRLDLGTSDI